MVDGVKQACDVAVQNTGWRILLRIAGLLVSAIMQVRARLTIRVQTLSMLFCRTFLFKIQESPSWLVNAGRPNDALIVLRHITVANGNPMTLDIADVTDSKADLDELEEDTSSSNGLRPPAEDGAYKHATEDDAESAMESKIPFTSGFQIRSDYTPPAWLQRLPPSLAETIALYLQRLDQLFMPEWKRTTILVWIIWTMLSAAYTLVIWIVPPGRRLMVCAASLMLSYLLGWKESSGLRLEAD